MGLNAAVGQRSCHLKACWTKSVDTIASRATWPCNKHTFFYIYVGRVNNERGWTFFSEFFRALLHSVSWVLHSGCQQSAYACQYKNLIWLEKMIMMWTAFFWIRSIGFLCEFPSCLVLCKQTVLFFGFQSFNYWLIICSKPLRFSL